MGPKRRLGVDPSNIIDGDSRGKRRKEADAPYPPESSSPPAEADAAAEAEELGQDMVQLEPTQIRDHGLQIWNAVKDARGKEGQDLSYDFMRLPSKRQYADYYVFIKHPICLEDIKDKLDSLQYSTIESVRQDLDLCFKNARKYNMKESGIYKAAKSLQKVVAAEYAKLTGSEEDDVDVVGDDGSGEEGDKRKKKQSLSRTLKNKLNKLCEKTDESGRILSTPFMEPPDRKLYADYYKIIKKVMCIEMIFKKLKRKEYQEVTAFTSDVELIFSNAMEYNADHSVIWEDAHVLRDHFRKIMATLPSEYLHYGVNTQNQVGKIKLKLPGSAPKQDLNISDGLHASPSLTLKLPGSVARQIAQPQPTASPLALAKKTPHTVQPQETAASVVPAGKPLLTAQPMTPATTSGSSRGVFPAKAASPAPNMMVPPPAQSITKQSTPQPQSYTPSPAPPEVAMKFPIQSILLQTTPYGRTFHLEREEGVRLWSVRLGMSEKGIRIAEIHFVEEKEGSDTGEEEEEEKSEKEEPASSRSQRGGKAKAGAKGTEDQKDKGGGSIKVVPPEASVKLNGSALRPIQSPQPVRAPDSRTCKQWQSELNTGCSTLEVRAGDAGEIWKVFLDRQGG